MSGVLSHSNFLNFFNTPWHPNRLTCRMKLTLKVILIGFIAGFGGAYVLYYFGIKPSLQKVEGERNAACPLQCR